MPPTTAIAVGLSLALGLVSGVAAQPGVGATIDMLDSPVLAERERATARLISDESFTLADTERLLASDSLTTEQRLRLEAVGLSLFSRTPRAGLGVQFGQPVAGRGAPLAAVIAGFPAAEFLKPGDLVLSINGESLANTNHMGSIILSHSPGATLRIELDRPLEPMVDPRDPPPSRRLTLDVPLGRFADLNNGMPTPPRIEAAYHQRLARNDVSHSPPVVGGGMSPLAWLRAEGYDESRGGAPSIATLPVSAWRVLSFGGQPASAVSNIEMRRGDEHAMMRRTSVALQADGVYDRIEETLAAYRALVRRLAQLRTLIDDAPTGELNVQQTRRLERVSAERREIETELESVVRMLDGGEATDGLSPAP